MNHLDRDLDASFKWFQYKCQLSGPPGGSSGVEVIEMLLFQPLNVMLVILIQLLCVE